jgi:hypothetical protein
MFKEHRGHHHRNQTETTKNGEYSDCTTDRRVGLPLPNQADRACRRGAPAGINRSRPPAIGAPADLVVGSIPLPLGLILVMPVLGHATWHLGDILKLKRHRSPAPGQCEMVTGNPPGCEVMAT